MVPKNKSLIENSNKNNIWIIYLIIVCEPSAIITRSGNVILLVYRRLS